MRAELAGQPHIDLARLEEAYYRVPVVTTAQLAEMVRMMEVFARYLSNTWKRLEIMSEFQQMRERELSLDRRELAEMLLSGQASQNDPAAMDMLQNLARNVGLERFPDRILLLRLQDPAEPAEASPPPLIAGAVSADGHRQPAGTLARVAHVIEDRCQTWPNTLATRRDSRRHVHLHQPEHPHPQPRAAAGR